jgi:GNAT superfamily N-acetyltransferase
MATATEVQIRGATTADAEVCGRILYEAFHGIATERGFPDDFPTAEFATMVFTWMAESPAHYGVVAERDGQIVGSNFLDERDDIRGVGPISVDPAVQGSGAGRMLMEAVIERGRGARGIRLLQDAFNPVSMSLYAGLGFDIKEPVVRIMGEPRSDTPADVEVRPLEHADLEACGELCRSVHGIERTGELATGIEGPILIPVGLFRDGRLTAYATTTVIWPQGHGVAETEEGLRALLLGGAAAAGAPLDFLLPTRSAELFRWALSEGLRVVKPMSLMSIGEYHEPQGAWYPSVIY